MDSASLSDKSHLAKHYSSMGSQRMASREQMPPAPIELPSSLSVPPKPDADKQSPTSVAEEEQITAKDMNTDHDDDVEQRLTKLLNVDNSRSSFEKSYTLKMKLMSGFFGTVYTGVHNSTGEKYAVKVVERR